jgi:hypothetical protein
VSGPLSAPARIRLLAREEAGLTLIEAMVAAMLLVAGTLATLQLFDVSARTAYRGEQSQVVNNRLQRELEEIRTLPFAQVALTSQPVAQAGSNDPRSRISGTRFALNRNGTNLAEMVFNGGPLEEGGTVSGGGVDPGPETFQSGDVQGQIFRYVVWQNDYGCVESLCPGQQDLKRVVIVVRLTNNAISDNRPYQEVQSDFFDPTHVNESTQIPTADEIQAQQFWLSDTTCNYSSRQEITGDHLLHNTLGLCSDGTQTGATLGAPDSLFVTEPPDPFPADPTLPLTYDYSTDIEPVQNPEGDRGMQLLKQDVDGCDYTPDGADPGRKAHRWLTPPIGAQDFVMDGKATLYVWSRTVNDALHAGKICLYLFVRDVNVEGQTVDTLILDADTSNPYFTHVEPSWPSAGWVRVIVPLRFALTRVTQGQRVGLAISVERAGTPGDGVQFLYDHPDYESRLEIETTTPLG